MVKSLQKLGLILVVNCQVSTKTNPVAEITSKIHTFLRHESSYKSAALIVGIKVSYKYENT